MPGGVVGSAGGSGVGGGGGGGGGGGSGAKGEAGGELFKVDLDPTGMYAAACSFDKVRAVLYYDGVQEYWLLCLPINLCSVWSRRSRLRHASA